MTDDETKWRRAAREAPTKWRAAIVREDTVVQDADVLEQQLAQPWDLDEARERWSEYDRLHRSRALNDEEPPPPGR